MKVDVNSTVEIGMGKGKRARDIIILAEQVDAGKAKVQKPQVAVGAEKPQPSAEPKEWTKDSKGRVVCLTCEKPASWTKECQRWYCYNDRVYL